MRDDINGYIYKLPWLGQKPKEFDISTELGVWIKAAWDYRDAYFELRDKEDKK